MNIEFMILSYKVRITARKIKPVVRDKKTGRFVSPYKSDVHEQMREYLNQPIDYTRAKDLTDAMKNEEFGR